MTIQIVLSTCLISAILSMCARGNAQNWTVTGNANTDPNRNFLGTTDNHALSMRTNGTEALRIDVLGNIGIGTSDVGGRVHVASGADFHFPQMILTQTTPLDFARLQFRSFTVDPDRPGVRIPLPLWDIAGGRGVLNFFRQDTGNVMTLSSGREPGASVLSPRVGIGTENPQSALHVIGTATVSVLQITGGSDVAEPFSIEGSADIEAGTVMTIDDHNPGKLKISDVAYDRKVVGVVSGAGGIRPGITLRHEGSKAGSVLIALSGRVYCRADTSNGPIEPGDFLTTSSLSGRAMRATDFVRAQGAIIGKALNGLKEGEGIVLVLANLQ